MSKKVCLEFKLSEAFENVFIAHWRSQKSSWVYLKNIYSRANGRAYGRRRFPLRFKKKKDKITCVCLKISKSHQEIQDLRCEDPDGGLKKSQRKKGEPIY